MWRTVLPLCLLLQIHFHICTHRYTVCECDTLTANCIRLVVVFHSFSTSLSLATRGGGGDCEKHFASCECDSHTHTHILCAISCVAFFFHPPTVTPFADDEEAAAVAAAKIAVFTFCAIFCPLALSLHHLTKLSFARVLCTCFCSFPLTHTRVTHCTQYFILYHRCKR